MELEKIKLSHIASIGSGLVVKRKQALNDTQIVKQYRMLTLKSFQQSGWLNIDELEDFQSNEELDKKYLTQKGDVIVRLSNPNTAIAISKNDTGILIPSLFAIIRLESHEVLADYLSIFLNSDYMKRIYTKRSVGSTIQIIKTSMLKDVGIELKSIENQKKVVELNTLIVKEKKLLEQLLEEKTKLHNLIINKII